MVVVMMVTDGRMDGWMVMDDERRAVMMMVTMDGGIFGMMVDDDGWGMMGEG